jgi:hypothetical protein
VPSPAVPGKVKLRKRTRKEIQKIWFRLSTIMQMLLYTKAGGRLNRQNIPVKMEEK